VVLHVAVERPDTRVVADERQVVTLGRADEHGVFRQLGRLRHGVAVGGDDREGVAVEVDGVGQVAGIDEPEQDPLAFSQLHPRDSVVGVTVDQEEVAAQLAAAQQPVSWASLGRSGRHRGGQLQITLLENVGVLAVVGPGRDARLDDERTVQAERHLQRRVGVGVVPAGAGRCGDEVVDEFGAGFDRGLVEPGRAVHRRGHVDAVPVDGGRHRELVAQRHADAVALGHPQLRAGHLPVVAPGPDGRAGHDLPVELAGGQHDVADRGVGWGS
jgi:hypothetical protein